MIAAAVDADRCASFDQADRLAALVGVLEELETELVGLRALHVQVVDELALLSRR